MSNLKLSIIVPCFNSAIYIEECLKSIYNQNISESDYEVICVDDKSSDNTVNVISDFCKHHSNLKLLVHDRNKKQGAARNSGLKIATGKYVWFIDSDDSIKVNIIQNILLEVEKQEIDILFFDYVKYSNDASKVFKNSSYNCRLDIFEGKDIFELKEFYEITSLCWNKLIRRAFLTEKQLFFYEEFYFEDVIFGIKCFYYSNRVRYISNVYYYYRDTPNSVMNNVKSGIFVLSYIKLAIEYKIFSNEVDIEYIKIQFADISRFYINSILKKVLHLSFKEREVFNSHLRRIENISEIYQLIDNKMIGLILNSSIFRFLLYMISPVIQFNRFIKLIFH